MGNPFVLCISLLKLNNDNNINTNKKLVIYSTIKIEVIILLQGFSEHLLCAARLLLRQPRFV
jgi:hypothetical protein